MEEAVMAGGVSYCIMHIHVHYKGRGDCKYSDVHNVNYKLVQYFLSLPIFSPSLWLRPCESL